MQLVNLRLTAIGRLPKVPMAGLGPAIHEFDVVPEQKTWVTGTSPVTGNRAGQRAREVWFPEIGSVPCPIHWRDGLAAGEALAGPAIIEAMDSTIVVPPGWIASVDGNGYIRLRRR